MLRLFILVLIFLAIGFAYKSPSFKASAPATAAIKTAEKKTAPAAPQKPAVQTKMVYMYSTTWCGVCKRARGELHKAGVRVTEFFVDRDKGRERELGLRLQKAGVPSGTVGVPIFFIGDQMLRGYGGVGDIQKAAF